MPAGRPRKPLEQKRLTARSATKDSAGRPLPDPSNIVALPGCGDEPPVMPDSIVDDGPGSKRWRDTWSAGKSWISPQTDFHLVVRLCEAEDMRTAMAADLGRDFMVTGSMGQMRPNPLIDKLRALDDQITKYEQLLGFSPSSRGTLGVAEVSNKSESAIEKLMRLRAEKSAADRTVS